ncbi:hypothetical protein LTR36_001979 [Oleoguttula mirabilis]|uniref:Uncharacterized protein n=1 Tax=Oleoguttula mirabilis TaxID=1507867 RepID=A0AAV9JP25_9PEZI|nr:hypothetical protein LTR36_001979 [Oleoguttula mirabilis]
MDFVVLTPQPASGVEAEAKAKAEEMKQIAIATLARQQEHEKQDGNGDNAAAKTLPDGSMGGDELAGKQRTEVNSDYVDGWLRLL